MPTLGSRKASIRFKKRIEVMQVQRAVCVVVQHQQQTSLFSTFSWQTFNLLSTMNEVILQAQSMA